MEIPRSFSALNKAYHSRIRCRQRKVNPRGFPGGVLEWLKCMLMEFVIPGLKKSIIGAKRQGTDSRGHAKLIYKIGATQILLLKMKMDMMVMKCHGYPPGARVVCF